MEQRISPLPVHLNHVVEVIPRKIAIGPRPAETLIERLDQAFKHLEWRLDGPLDRDEQDELVKYIRWARRLIEETGAAQPRSAIVRSVEVGRD